MVGKWQYLERVEKKWNGRFTIFEVISRQPTTWTITDTHSNIKFTITSTSLYQWKSDQIEKIITQKIEEIITETRNTKINTIIS